MHHAGSAPGTGSAPSQQSAWVPPSFAVPGAVLQDVLGALRRSDLPSARIVCHAWRDACDGALVDSVRVPVHAFTDAPANAQALLLSRCFGRCTRGAVVLPVMPSSCATSAEGIASTLATVLGQLPCSISELHLVQRCACGSRYSEDAVQSCWGEEVGWSLEALRLVPMRLLSCVGRLDLVISRAGGMTHLSELTQLRRLRVTVTHGLLPRRAVDADWLQHLEHLTEVELNFLGQRATARACGAADRRSHRQLMVDSPDDQEDEEEDELAVVDVGHGSEGAFNWGQGRCFKLPARVAVFKVAVRQRTLEMCLAAAQGNPKSTSAEGTDETSVVFDRCEVAPPFACLAPILPRLRALTLPAMSQQGDHDYDHGGGTGTSLPWLPRATALTRLDIAGVTVLCDLLAMLPLRAALADALGALKQLRVRVATSDDLRFIAHLTPLTHLHLLIDADQTACDVDEPWAHGCHSAPDSTSYMSSSMRCLSQLTNLRVLKLEPTVSSASSCAAWDAPYSSTSSFEAAGGGGGGSGLKGEVFVLLQQDWLRMQCGWRQLADLRLRSTFEGNTLDIGPVSSTLRSLALHYVGAGHQHPHPAPDHRALDDGVQCFQQAMSHGLVQLTNQATPHLFLPCLRRLQLCNVCVGPERCVHVPTLEALLLEGYTSGGYGASVVQSLLHAIAAPNLLRLHFRRCALVDKDVEALTACFPALEEVRMAASKVYCCHATLGLGVRALSRLRHLKVLELHASGPTCVSDMDMLVELRELRVLCLCLESPVLSKQCLFNDAENERNCSHGTLGAFEVLKQMTNLKALIVPFNEGTCSRTCRELERQLPFCDVLFRNFDAYT